MTKDRKLFEKAREVARKFGQIDAAAGAKLSKSRGDETIVHVFNDAAGLDVRFISTHIDYGYNHDIEIFFEGRPVFSEHSSSYPDRVNRYSPGPWEKRLDDLYAKVAMPQTAPQKQAAGPAKRTPAEVAAERQNKLKKAKPVTKLRLRA